jgi:hypothetical protein
MVVRDFLILRIFLGGGLDDSQRTKNKIMDDSLLRSELGWKSVYTRPKRTGVRFRADTKFERGVPYSSE